MGRELSTGIEMDAELLQVLMGRSQMRGPICNVDHWWSTSDAYLGSPAPSAPRFRGCSLTNKARRTNEPGLASPRERGGSATAVAHSLKKTAALDRKQCDRLGMPLQERHLFKCAAYALLIPFRLLNIRG